MSWTKIDDAILTNPKMEEAEERCPAVASALWFRALVYTNQHKLDGFVPSKRIPDLMKRHRLTTKAVKTLVEVGLWDEVDDGFLFHNFAKHNKNAEQRADLAQANRDKVAAFRERKRQEEGSEPAPVTGYTPGYTPGGVTDPVTASRAGVRASRPVPPVPSLPSRPSDGGGEASADDDPDPTEAELFRAYSAGVSQASALTLTHTRSEDNAFALSSVRGTHEPNMPKAEFLAWLVAQAKAYVADAMARGQERKYEKNYAPAKFLVWLETRKAGGDPFPLAPVALGGGARRGSQGSPLQSPPKTDLKLVPDEPEVVPAPLDDPARLACLRALSGMSGAG